MSFDKRDIRVEGALSNCCGAYVIHTDVCSSCFEHCETITEDDDNLPENNIEASEWPEF
jgi:hypothetical protein